jgi:hypothetical protein
VGVAADTAAAHATIGKIDLSTMTRHLLLAMDGKEGRTAMHGHSAAQAREAALVDDPTKNKSRQEAAFEIQDGAPIGQRE